MVYAKSIRSRLCYNAKDSHRITESLSIGSIFYNGYCELAIFVVPHNIQPVLINQHKSIVPRILPTCKIERFLLERFIVTVRLKIILYRKSTYMMLALCTAVTVDRLFASAYLKANSATRELAS